MNITNISSFKKDKNDSHYSMERLKYYIRESHLDFVDVNDYLNLRPS